MFGVIGMMISHYKHPGSVLTSQDFIVGFGPIQENAHF